MRLYGSPSLTDWLSAAAGLGTTVIALIALIAAFGQIGEARAARQQARELDRERSEPYVVMYFEPDALIPMALYLKNRNYGSTGAYDVRFAITPWPRRAIAQNTAGSDNDADKVVLPDVIRTLAPNQEMSVLWDMGPERASSDLPDEHEVTVTYSGLNGAQLSSRSHLDWSMYKGRRWGRDQVHPRRGEGAR